MRMLRPRVFRALALALVVYTSILPAAYGQAGGPKDVITLADAGFGDNVLRGRYVSADYFISGPGDYRLAAAGSTLELVFDATEILARTSSLTALWNGIPIGDRQLLSQADVQRWTLSLPTNRIVTG